MARWVIRVMQIEVVRGHQYLTLGMVEYLYCTACVLSKMKCAIQCD